MRNGSVLALGNPSFNSLLCPTSRSVAAPPDVLHLTRGFGALGRCAAEALPEAEWRLGAAYRSGGWKGALLFRVMRDGLQEVRDPRVE